MSILKMASVLFSGRRYRGRFLQFVSGERRADCGWEFHVLSLIVVHCGDDADHQDQRLDFTHDQRHLRVVRKVARGWRYFALSLSVKVAAVTISQAFADGVVESQSLAFAFLSSKSAVKGNYSRVEFFNIDPHFNLSGIVTYDSFFSRSNELMTCIACLIEWSLWSATPSYL